LTVCRAADIVADSEKERLNFLFATSEAAKWARMVGKSGAQVN